MFKDSITLIVQSKRNEEGYWPYTYYWPMSNDTVSSNAMYDKGQSQTQADLHGVKFIDVPKLIQAVSLKGNKQWIDVDGGELNIYIYTN